MKTDLVQAILPLPGGYVGLTQAVLTGVQRLKQLFPGLPQRTGGRRCGLSVMAG